jgi:hypothetical protein
LTCRPGHSPQHPPFAAGNAEAVTHGVFRANRAEQIAAEVEAIAEEIATTFPWTSAYRDERVAYARTLVDERTVRAYLDDVGVLDEHHQERPAVRTLARFSASAARSRSALGLSPMAHARLLSLVADVVRLHGDRAGPLDTSLDAVLAEGARLVAAHDAAPALPASTDNSGDPAVRGAEIEAQPPENQS